MTIPFGKFKGCELDQVPDSYCRWLAMRGSFTNPMNRFETTWKVPISLSIEARREMERRGYQRVDDTYIKI
jgi:uncharacterized protein (DUF3820 family)